MHTCPFFFCNNFPDVTGTLEGETIVAKSIPRMPVFGCYMESQQSRTQHHEQAQDWRDLIHKLLEFPECCLSITTTKTNSKARMLG